MCSSHGTHVTVVRGLPRCVLCGHEIFKRLKTGLTGWPRELYSRFRARQAWWNTPVFYDGVFRY